MGVAKETTKVMTDADTASKPEDESPSADIIYVDPEKEKAALDKFDKWLVPVAFIFMVLSSLDRNNVRIAASLTPSHTNADGNKQVGNAKVFGFEKDLDLYGNRFGII